MRLRDDRGSGTVLALGLVALLLMLLTAAAALGSAVLASERARTAADSAAIAGASAVNRLPGQAHARPAVGPLPGSVPGPLPASVPTDACSTAGRFARLNHAELVRCAVAGADVSVLVRVRPGFPGLGPAIATARAGPAHEG